MAFLTDVMQKKTWENAATDHLTEHINVNVNHIYDKYDPHTQALKL
jgi:hypothetical protein